MVTLDKLKQAKISRKNSDQDVRWKLKKHLKTDYKLITVMIIILHKVFQLILLLAWLSMWCKINANYRLILVPCLASSVRLRIAYKVPAVAKLSSSSPTMVSKVIVYKSCGEQCLLKSVHFKKTVFDPHFFQNCCHFQYNISWLCFDSADVVLKMATILKEMKIENCLLKMNRL